MEDRYRKSLMMKLRRALSCATGGLSFVERFSPFGNAAACENGDVPATEGTQTREKENAAIREK
jgi:hypothetical protein